MIATDLVRGAVLVPIAVAGLIGDLPLWGLVVAAFVLESATSYFAPAYGAPLPALVDRKNVQQANALVQSTAQALSVAGWALAVCRSVPSSRSTPPLFFLSALLICRRSAACRSRRR